jgi:hypothetical protein
MTTRRVLLSVSIVLTLAAAARAQNAQNFSGTWKLQKADPPVATGRGGGGGGGGRGDGAGEGGAAYGENAFSATPSTLVITQSGNNFTIQVGSQKEPYTLDDKLTVTPPGDIAALKTHAHWDGAALHLHFKEGMSFGRDVLTMNGNTLTVLRDLETGGQSTTRTLTYVKAQ